MDIVARAEHVRVSPDLPTASSESQRGALVVIYTSEKRAHPQRKRAA